MKAIGKPDGRNRHVRFDERGRESGRPFSVSTRVRPRLYIAAETLTDCAATGKLYSAFADKARVALSKVPHRPLVAAHAPLSDRQAVRNLVNRGIMLFCCPRA